MANRLSNKVAIVTGASRGIGAAVTKLFLAEGASVMATDILGPELSLMVRELKEQNFPVEGLELDVSRESQWQEVLSRTLERFGKLDILVNNAGIAPMDSSLPQLGLEQWSRVLSINLNGTFLGIKYCLPYLEQNQKGSIVNISSIAGITGMAGGTAYTASKGAIRIFTKGVALDYGKHQIRVNSVHPGVIRTPMTDGLLADPAVRDGFISKNMLPRLGEPLDIAYGVLYLASDESDFVTGSELVIDGGYTAS